MPRSVVYALLGILVGGAARADEPAPPLSPWLRGAAELAAPPPPAPPVLVVPRGRPLPRRPAGNASASFEYTRVADALGSAENLYAFGQHAVILPKGGSVVQMQDSVIGGAGGGGFVYQLDTLFGPGRWFGDAGFGLAGGIGVDGITGHRIPIGMRLPIRAWSSVNLGPTARIEASGEVAWIAWTSPRRGRGAAFGDELVGRLGIYVGGRGRDAGFFVGLTARQAMGTTLFTLGMGAGLAAAAVD